MNTTRTATLLAVLLATGTSLAAAQRVRTDPATGDRIITYTVNGIGYEAVVPGTYRIEPEVRLVSITEASGIYTYSYRLLNHDGPRSLPHRGTWMTDIPCAGVSANDVIGAPSQ